MGFKKWKLPQTAPERVENLISQTGMERIAAQISTEEASVTHSRRCSISAATALQGCTTHS